MLLLVSAHLSWIALALGVVALGALGYAGVVLRRTIRQTSYQPVLEDRIWHVCLPLLAYGAQMVAALMLVKWPVRAMFVVGAAMVLLLFVGIHNAWDTVVFIGLRQRGGDGESGS